MGERGSDEWAKGERGKGKGGLLNELLKKSRRFTLFFNWRKRVNSKRQMGSYWTNF
jgi:hypothetical protein